jgi:hypothetical protein
MKVKAKNIAVRLLSMLLCLHMLYMISGRTSWYSDVFASYRSHASVIAVSDPVNESTPESDATADDSATVSLTKKSQVKFWIIFTFLPIAC